jgi:hypothetical protein
VNLHVYPTSHGTFGFISKVLNIDTGVYYVELPVRGTSILVPLKYVKHKRQNKKAGGDAGVFKIPQTFLRTLMVWGIQPGHVYVRIWRIGRNA